MVVSLTSPQDALDALRTDVVTSVFVGGVTVDCAAWDVRFGVDVNVATCRLTIPLPRPETVEANARVEIQAGHNDLVGVVFSGRIPAWESALDMRGAVLTVRPEGWCSLLAYPERFDLIYDGPITLSALFDSLCARRGVPSYRADTVTDSTGEIEITMGGNPQIDEGKVIVPASQSPLSFLNSAADLFGYRVYDTPDGTVRLTRVSGLPVSDPVVTFTEGVHPHRISRSYSIAGITNYWDVIGQTYEDEYGASIPIRAFPATIPSDDLIPVNGGVAYRQMRSSLLVTQPMAEFVRQVKEIDTSAPDTPVRWDAIATPGVSPGDVVEVDADTVEADGVYWLTDLDMTYSDRGLTATYGGWAGGGEALPAGDNRTEYTIQTAPLHLGDETLSHYAVPVPSGTSETWNITIPERATALNVTGLHHGTNSQIVGGVQTDLEVTKWQLWDADVPPGDYDDTGTDAPRPVSSGNMPVVNENLSQRLDYDNLAYWSRFSINLRSVDAGEYVLRLVSGTKAGKDDFEVRNVELHVYGIAEPVVLPQEGE